MRGSIEQQRGFACPQEPFDDAYLDALTRARSSRLAELFSKCFASTLRARAPDLLDALKAFCAEPGQFPDSWPAALGELRAAMLTRPLDPEAALVAAEHLARARGLAGRQPEPPLARVRGVPVRVRSLPDGLTCSERPEIAGYEAAFDIIATAAPVYLPWVERVVHTLVPVQSRPGGTTSSSFELLPGVVALSYTSPAICLADALVHEASHQHFYLLAQAGPVHDGSDTDLYYSPGPRAERPIDRILLAYHAFANILLFYRACRQSRLVDADVCLRREQSYAQSLAMLDAPLEKTAALTTIGRSLYEPLAERVRASTSEPTAARAAESCAPARAQITA